MNDIKFVVTILLWVVVVIEIMLIMIPDFGVFYDIEKTGKKVCSICIEDGEQKPCNCEEVINYTVKPVIWIFSIITALLLFLFLLIPEEGKNWRYI